MKSYIKFIFIGTIGTMIELGLFYILSSRINLYFATYISYWINVSISYYLNSKYTFLFQLSRSKYAKYMTVAVVMSFLDLIIVTQLATGINWYAMNPTYAKLTSIMILSVAAYNLHKYFTYKDKE